MPRGRAPAVWFSGLAFLLADCKPVIFWVLKKTHSQHSWHLYYTRYTIPSVSIIAAFPGGLGTSTSAGQSTAGRRHTAEALWWKWVSAGETRKSISAWKTIKTCMLGFLSIEYVWIYNYMLRNIYYIVIYSAYIQLDIRIWYSNAPIWLNSFWAFRDTYHLVKRS